MNSGNKLRLLWFRHSEEVNIDYEFTTDDKIQKDTPRMPALVDGTITVILVMSNII